MGQEVSITRDGLTNDDDDSPCADLESIFDGRSNRVQENQLGELDAGNNYTKDYVEKLMSVDEELYTRKLERGPEMRVLEMETSRIAREIEGEDTQYIHLAEERGIHLHDNFEASKEIQYSSSGFNEIEKRPNSHNAETFGRASDLEVPLPPSMPAANSPRIAAYARSNDRLGDAIKGTTEEIQALRRFCYTTVCATFGYQVALFLLVLSIKNGAPTSHECQFARFLGVFSGGVFMCGMMVVLHQCYKIHSYEIKQQELQNLWSRSSRHLANNRKLRGLPSEHRFNVVSPIDSRVATLIFYLFLLIWAGISIFVALVPSLQFCWI